jgi:hypothetical protein
MVCSDVDGMLVRVNRILGALAEPSPESSEFKSFPTVLGEFEFEYAIPAGGMVILKRKSSDDEYSFRFGVFYQNRLYYETDFRTTGLLLPLHTFDSQTDGGNEEYVNVTFKEFLDGTLPAFPSGVRKLDISEAAPKRIGDSLITTITLNWSLELNSIIDDGIRDISGCIVCQQYKMLQAGGGR